MRSGRFENVITTVGEIPSDLESISVQTSADLINASLNRFQHSVASDSDYIALAAAYDWLNDPTPLSEELLATEGFRKLDEDAETMWMLGAGQMQFDICYSFKSKTLEIDSIPVCRGKVTLSDVRLLLRALRKTP